MKKELVELVFILDKSGSMAGLEGDTIGGYNSMLDKQKSVEGECHITTVLFDHNYELLHDRIDIHAISPISDKEYFVGGMTALLDAVGLTINKIAKVQKNTAKEYRAEKVMFVIITDGYENASKEYSSDKVKKMIEKQKKEFDWEFVFLGANIDAVETAGNLGISADRAVDYLSDSEGTRLSYQAMSSAVAAYRQLGKIDESSLEKIRTDKRKRGNRK
ncbi:MAG: VWA domain-containing protein [Clostridiaceae bacterium]|nr:VWA domain-containing protein [Clostridiaceae bacterium]